MADFPSNHGIQRLSGLDSKILDSSFSEFGDDFGVCDSGDGFEPVIPEAPNAPSEGNGRGVRRGSFNDVKMLPVTFTTDSTTATQVLMLLEVIRYCLEGSKEVVDSVTGEAKPYEFTVKVRNRGKTDFIVSVGDDSLPPIPVPDEPFLIGS